MSNDVALVAVTGGPCAGKTTILSFLRERLGQSRDVYFANEAATQLIGQGMAIKDAVHAYQEAAERSEARAKSAGRIIEYQLEIMKACLENEQRMLRCARIEGRPAIILCDRGIPDCRAYLEESQDGERLYDNLLAECGLSQLNALDRYKGVIKLTTAADGAEDFYTLNNNVARDETPEYARVLDRRVQEAYLGHSHLAVIDNSTDFERKKLRALGEICRILGMPEPREKERKYLLAGYPCFAHFDVPLRRIMIEQGYLLPGDMSEEVRIRRRSIGNSSTYYLTKKRSVRPGERIETEEEISWRTYDDLLRIRDQSCDVLRKIRHCFIYEGRYFELDVFADMPDSLCLLEVEVDDLSEEIALPPFLNVEEEVTGNPLYSNHELARQSARCRPLRKNSVPVPH